MDTDGLWRRWRSWPTWVRVALGGLAVLVLVALLRPLLVLGGLAAAGLGVVVWFRPVRVGSLGLAGRATAVALVVGGLVVAGVAPGLLGEDRGDGPPTRVAQAPPATATSTEAATTTSPTSTTTSTSAPSTTRTPHPVGATGLPEGDDRAVERIVDGDTLVVTGGERVRLIGVDTPEPSQDQCYAREATRFLAELLPPGTAVWLVYDVERTDRYGRTLAYLYRGEDGLFVNAEILARGYGQILTVPPNVAHQEEFLALQREARQEARGLWSACLGTTTTGASAGGTGVVIAAVNFDAPGNDNQNPNGEWVRLRNEGSGPVELTGWRLEDQGPNHVYRFPAGFVLEAGAEVTVFTGCGTDCPTELYWCKSTSAVWNNSGDVASLFDPSGALADRREG